MSLHLVRCLKALRPSAKVILKSKALPYNADEDVARATKMSLIDMTNANKDLIIVIKNEHKNKLLFDCSMSKAYREGFAIAFIAGYIISLATDGDIRLIKRSLENVDHYMRKQSMTCFICSSSMNSFTICRTCLHEVCCMCNMRMLLREIEASAESIEHVYRRQFKLQCPFCRHEYNDMAQLVPSNVESINLPFKSFYLVICSYYADEIDRLVSDCQLSVDDAGDLYSELESLIHKLDTFEQLTYSQLNI